MINKEESKMLYMILVLCVVFMFIGMAAANRLYATRWWSHAFVVGLLFAITGAPLGYMGDLYRATHSRAHLILSVVFAMLFLIILSHTYTATKGVFSGIRRIVALLWGVIFLLIGILILNAVLGKP
jgi:hypothetical protein